MLLIVTALTFFHGIDDDFQLIKGESAANLGVSIFGIFKAAITGMPVDHFGEGGHVRHFYFVCFQGNAFLIAAAINGALSRRPSRVIFPSLYC